MVCTASAAVFDALGVCITTGCQHFFTPCCRLILHFKALYKQNYRLCCLHWSQNIVILFPTIQCKEMLQNSEMSIYNSVTVKCFSAVPWQKKKHFQAFHYSRGQWNWFSPLQNTLEADRDVIKCWIIDISQVWFLFKAAHEHLHTNDMGGCCYTVQYTENLLSLHFLPFLGSVNGLI